MIIRSSFTHSKHTWWVNDDLWVNCSFGFGRGFEQVHLPLWAYWWIASRSARVCVGDTAVSWRWSETLAGTQQPPYTQRHTSVLLQSAAQTEMSPYTGGGGDLWPSIVTRTRNLCSAFNPSKCTHTAVSSEQTHTHTHTHTHRAVGSPGSSWGFGALLKGLTSVMVLRVERALVIHSPHLQSLPDMRLEPATFGLQVWLSNH